MSSLFNFYKGCNVRLISGRYGVKDEALSASSVFNLTKTQFSTDNESPIFGPVASRISFTMDGTVLGSSAWVPADDDENPWIQVRN